MAIRGKYGNYHVMRRDPVLHISLPETKIFTSDNFHQMINSYGSVIVKPTFGSGGAGVMKVSSMGGGKYLIHTGTRKTAVPGKTATFANLKRFIKSKPYIVQRYISLAKVNGRPCDLRVMVQRKKGGPWTITGKVAKVAGANQIITNVARSKGYILPAMNALTKTFSRSKSSSILWNLDRIGLRAAKQLGQTYGFRIIGFDMAVENNGKTWILESNSEPVLSLFSKLKDKSQYRAIMRYR